jgi:hypothetical protein
MKLMALLFSAAALAVLLTGCTTSSDHGAYLPVNTTTNNVESTAKFVLLDAGAQHSVTCSGLEEGKTADGRMKVSANLRNRENRRIEVQANCVFKNAQGFAVDETTFRTVILDENATEGVSFESLNTGATTYTIRIRQAR